MSFLLSLGAEPNKINNENLTPLHLAVRTIEEHESKRNVKALLLEGARRDIRDHNGKFPIDFCADIQDPTIYNEMIQILSEPSSWM